MHGTRTNAPARPASSSWRTTAAVSCALAALVLLSVVADWLPVLRLDRQVADLLHAEALAHPDWTRTNRILTDWVWDPWTMRLLLATAVGRLWLRGERPAAVWTAVTALLATAVQQGLKAVVGRERPQWEQPVDSANYAAMPSGHAMTAAVACVLLIWLVHRSGAGSGLRRAAAVLATVSVVGVCLTRVALGVHWPTDTVVGALLGVALAAGSVAAWHARGPVPPRSSPTA